MSENITEEQLDILKYELHLTLLDNSVVKRVGKFNKELKVTDSFLARTYPSTYQLFDVNEVIDGLIFCVEKKIQDYDYIKSTNDEDFCHLTPS